MQVRRGALGFRRTTSPGRSIFIFSVLFCLQPWPSELKRLFTAFHSRPLPFLSFKPIWLSFSRSTSSNSVSPWSSVMLLLLTTVAILVHKFELVIDGIAFSDFFPLSGLAYRHSYQTEQDIEHCFLGARPVFPEHSRWSS